MAAGVCPAVKLPKGSISTTNWSPAPAVPVDLTTMGLSLPSTANGCTACPPPLNVTVCGVSVVPRNVALLNVKPSLPPPHPRRRSRG